MRSRYSAHVLGLVDYVIKTYHPSCHAESEREGIADSVNSDWQKLEIVATQPGEHAQEGFVEFNAYLNDNGQEFCLSEKSRFIQEDNLWFYIDGVFPDQQNESSDIVTDQRLTQSIESLKVGRNDPCICGSGKKFKKCCG
ncbi:hypothetical protein BCU68_01540 [Vibrio sp. 10N.286.49.B3]|nr:hypothetical protein BCU68_01540 [Vibrio sp. 10N.286.49.B3]